jgi:small conductance mechanosensitive channel
MKLLKVLLVLAALLVPVHVRAQAPAPAPDAAAVPSPDEIEKLIRAIDDEASRRALIEQLRTLVELQRSGQVPAIAPTADQPAEQIARVASTFTEQLSDQIEEATHAVLEAAAFLADAPKFLSWFDSQIGDRRNRDRLVEIAWKLLAALAVGWIVEWATLRALGPLRTRLEARAAGQGWRRIFPIAADAIVGILPIAVFAATAIGTLGLVQPTRTASLVTISFVNAHVLARVVALAANTIFAPRHPGRRPVAVGDETAVYIFLWIRRVSTIAVYWYFAAQAALLLGMPAPAHNFVVKLLGVVVAMMTVAVVLQNRQSVSEALLRSAREGGWIARGRAGFLGPGLAKYWHIAALAYVLVALFAWLLRPDGFAFIVQASVLTFVIAGVARAAVLLTAYGIDRIFVIAPEFRERFPALEQRANRYVSAGRRVIALAISGLALLAIMQAWGIRTLEYAATPTGQRVAGGLFSIAFAVIAALAIWEFANAGLERYLLRKGESETPTERTSARVRTLMPLMQRALFVLLAIFVVLVTLNEIGVNVTPLLAGAGVLGLAVGLGAQNMVRDLITGVSMILEDVLAVGDVVQLGDKSGTVESLGLRAIKLRSGDGTLHTIPFGSLTTISNQTKDYAFATFEVPVPYSADAAAAAAAMRKTFEDIAADGEIGGLVIGEYEDQGIAAFTDVGQTLKARVKTLPGKQWRVRRAFDARIRRDFAAAGIKLAWDKG